jgi:hypothetical protein
VRMALRSRTVHGPRRSCLAEFAWQIGTLSNLGSAVREMAMRYHGLPDSLAFDCNFLLLESVLASAGPTQGPLLTVLEK